ncbi:MAG: TIGR03936 family radical SAM-associated protein [Fervidobacterium sp.]
MQVIIHFKKKGLLRFLSAIETSNAIIRTLNRSGLDMEFSEGFHPLPKVSFLDSTATGVIDLALYVMVKLRNEQRIDHLIESIRKNLPNGLEVQNIFESEVNLNKIVDKYKYMLFFKDKPNFEKPLKKHSGKVFIPAEIIDNLTVTLKKDLFVVKYTISKDKVFNPYLLDNIYLAVRTNALISGEDVSKILGGQII